LIEDTEILIYNGLWWESPVNLFGTLIVAFFLYQIGAYLRPTSVRVLTLSRAGRLIAHRVKQGALFSAALQRLGNADRRMQHELDMQLSHVDVDDRISNMRWNSRYGRAAFAVPDTDGLSPSLLMLLLRCCGL
jgi:hypothetical protein